MSNKEARTRVLSRKELAEAGRKKLEAFRKKKAAEREQQKAAANGDTPERGADGVGGDRSPAEKDAAVNGDVHGEELTNGRAADATGTLADSRGAPLGDAIPKHAPHESMPTLPPMPALFPPPPPPPLPPPLRPFPDSPSEHPPPSTSASDTQLGGSPRQEPELESAGPTSSQDRSAGIDAPTDDTVDDSAAATHGVEAEREAHAAPEPKPVADTAPELGSAPLPSSLSMSGQGVASQDPVAGGAVEGDSLAAEADSKPSLISPVAGVGHGDPPAPPRALQWAPRPSTSAGGDLAGGKAFPRAEPPWAPPRSLHGNGASARLFVPQPPAREPEASARPDPESSGAAEADEAADPPTEAAMPRKPSRFGSMFSNFAKSVAAAAAPPPSSGPASEHEGRQSPQRPGRGRSAIGKLARTVASAAAPPPAGSEGTSLRDDYPLRNGFTQPSPPASSSKWLDDLVAANFGPGSGEDDASALLPRAPASEPAPRVPLSDGDTASTTERPSWQPGGSARPGSLAAKYSVLSDSYLTKRAEEAHAKPGQLLGGRDGDRGEQVAGTSPVGAPPSAAADSPSVLPNGNAAHHLEEPSQEPKPWEAAGRWSSSGRQSAAAGSRVSDEWPSRSPPVTTIIADGAGKPLSAAASTANGSASQASSARPSPPASVRSNGQLSSFSRYLGPVDVPPAEEEQAGERPVPNAPAARPQSAASAGWPGPPPQEGERPPERPREPTHATPIPTSNGHLSDLEGAPSRPPRSVRSARAEPVHDDGSQFKELQQYIDDLTTEKYELQRGMEQQSRLAATLASENESLTQDFNQMAKSVESLRKQVAKYEEEIQAQLIAMDGLAKERDGSRAGAKESSERAKALASEVVSLEEQILKLRSSELKLQKDLERATEARDKSDRHAASLEKDRRSLRQEVEALKEEKRALAVRLRRATVAAELAGGAPEQTRGASGRLEEANASTQTELEGRRSNEAAGAPGGAALKSAEVQTVDSVAVPTPDKSSSSKLPHPAEVMTRMLGDAAEDAEHDQLSSGTPSGRMATDAASQLASPEHDPPEAQSLLLPGAESLLPSRRPWLDQGPGAAALALGQEERRIVEQVNSLLDQLEEQRRDSDQKLRSAEAEAGELRETCQQLRSKLEATTQRLELAISHSASRSGAPQPQPAYSGRPGASLAHTDRRGGSGWLLGAFSRSKRNGLQ